ncbi:MAG TPA: CHAT domain-containing protein [Panacibacter sp.]|nr:CHAT domain-containing protein [Panacibacter sp.]
MAKDSVYARLLSKIGVYEFIVAKNYDSAIKLTLQAVHINISGTKDCSEKNAIDQYFNLGLYFTKLMFYSKALVYHDSAIVIAQKYSDTKSDILDSKLEKSNIFYLLGDFEKSIEESTKGIAQSLENKDSSHYISFLYQRTRSFLLANNFKKAESDAQLIINTEKYMDIPFEYAGALKTMGLICEEKKDTANAILFFKQSIKQIIQIQKYEQVVSDYIDFGNFYLNSLGNYAEARACYFKAINYAQKDKNIFGLAAAYTNLGEVSFSEQHYNEAGNYYTKALQILKLFHQKNILENPPASFFDLIGNKDLVTVLLVKKGKLLLQLFKETKDNKFLNACLQTSMVTDSVITQTRHEQSGEQSKLYWRNKTREFFTNAMEACYLANDTKNAFFFMEKSRAVLLNDKLNELGANAHLSASDAQQEQNFQIKIIVEQQKLNDLAIDTKAYKEQQLKLFAAKDDFEHFTQSLGKKYPAYYEYKYADRVPALADLQERLATNHQSFAHYFMNDTVMYILSITPGNAKIARLSKNDFDFAQVNNFLQYCSNKSFLNTHYKSFAALSNSLYKSLFQRLQLPKGRVVICSDNFLIPFEALCSDMDGTQFLIYNYNFSYVYSATYLMKDFKTYPANGNFIGFAPVSFQTYLDVASLTQSETALKKSADNYSNSLLLTNEAATKKSFIQKIAGYSVVNVFSHASADSTYAEPRIYMQDSIIKLSDLQLLNKPATRLVVLSACQTNVGKNATGEGIYSLARGFASAGIPSVAATLWNADEDMIYEVSATFHEYLAQGISKDSALQKAKIDFINKHKGSEKLLPYYWANMILIGNTAPLELSADSNLWWLICGVALLLIAVFIQSGNESKTKQNNK